MKTLTVTAARAKLGYWLKRAAKGEQIGIVYGTRVFPLRPAPIEAGDYAEQEFGLTREEMDAAAERIRAESKRMLESGETVSLEEALRVLNRPRRKKSTRASRRASGR